MSDIRKRTGTKGTTYQVRYPSKAAKSGYAYATFDTLKEARAFTETLGSLKHAPGGRTLQVPKAIDIWLDTCEKHGRDGRETVEPETLKEYKRRANVMKEYRWRSLVHELASSDIIQFRNWLIETKSRDLARRTLSSFHSVLIEMKHQGFVQDDPAAGISIRSGGRYEDDEEIEIPTDREMRDILSAADVMGKKNDYMEKCWARYRPMIYLAALSGMRPSEYRGLPWPNITKDEVHVRQRADKTGIIGPVKSKAGRRTIYLPSIVTDMVFEWRKRCPKSEYDLIFPTKEGNPILLAKFAEGAWTPLMREAGLMTTQKQDDGETVSRPRYTPYALRHYYASKLIEQGKDFKYIQNVMGHSRIEITFNVYGHLIRGNEKAHKRDAQSLALSILKS